MATGVGSAKTSAGNGYVAIGASRTGQAANEPRKAVPTTGHRFFSPFLSESLADTLPPCLPPLSGGWAWKRSRPFLWLCSPPGSGGRRFLAAGEAITGRWHCTTRCIPPCCRWAEDPTMRDSCLRAPPCLPPRSRGGAQCNRVFLSSLQRGFSNCLQAPVSVVSARCLKADEQVRLTNMIGFAIHRLKPVADRLPAEGRQGSKAKRPVRSQGSNHSPPRRDISRAAGCVLRAMVFWVLDF